jgi:hypothetical protein
LQGKELASFQPRSTRQACGTRHELPAESAAVRPPEEFLRIDNRADYLLFDHHLRHDHLVAPVRQVAAAGAAVYFPAPAPSASYTFDMARRLGG